MYGGKKVKRIALLILTAALLAASLALPASAADKVPYMQFIQAESLPCDKGGAVVKDDKGAIGGKGLTVTEKASSAADPGFTLTFTVDVDGDYTVWGRAFFPNQSSNSLFYSVDGGESLIWDFPDEDGEAICYNSWQYFYLTFREKGTFTDTAKYGKWTIENSDWRHSPNVLRLTAGEHKIKFAGREANWILDEFVITNLKVEEYDPNDQDGANKCILPECKFCGTNWKHYYKDMYSQGGPTAAEYYRTAVLPKYVKAETTAAAKADGGGTGGAAKAAPQTLDPLTVTLAAAALSAALIPALKLKKRR